MATLCVLGPDKTYMTCEMMKNVNKVINLYCQAPNYNIVEIITTDQSGVAKQARYYAEKHCLKLKVYQAESYSSLFNLYKAMIKKSNFLLIFTFNDQRRLIVEAAQYAVNHDVSANVIELLF